MSKKYFDFEWMIDRCGECYICSEVTAQSTKDQLAVSECRKRLFQWYEGKRTYTRLLALEAALQAHPDTHWAVICGGHIRLYSTRDGQTVCEI